MVHETMKDKAPGDVVRIEYERQDVRGFADVTTQEHPLLSMAAQSIAIGGPPEIPYAHDTLLGEPNVFFARMKGPPLQLHDLDADLGRYFGVTEGVLVLAAPESEQGLESGDVIRAVAGKPVANAAECFTTLMHLEGETNAEVIRDGGQQTVLVSATKGAGWQWPAGGRVFHNVIRSSSDAAPGDAAPADAAPEDATPEDAAPEESVDANVDVIVEEQ